MGGVVASEVAVTKGDRIKGSVMLGPPLPSPTVKKTFEGRVKAVEEGGLRSCGTVVQGSGTEFVRLNGR